MYYPPTIREDASSSSEARDAPGHTEATAALAITSSKESAEESGLSGAVETDEGQNLDAPQEIIGSTGDAPVSLTEGLVLLVELL